LPLVGEILDIDIHVVLVSNKLTVWIENYIFLHTMPGYLGGTVQLNKLPQTTIIFII